MKMLYFQPSKNPCGRTVSSLKLPHGKIDGWKTIHLPVRALPCFRCELLVSGRVLGSFHIPDISLKYEDKEKSFPEKKTRG